MPGVVRGEADEVVCLRSEGYASCGLIVITSNHVNGATQPPFATNFLFTILPLNVELIQRGNLLAQRPITSQTPVQMLAST